MFLLHSALTGLEPIPRKLSIVDLSIVYSTEVENAWNIVTCFMQLELCCPRQKSQECDSTCYGNEGESTSVSDVITRNFL
jgi:hypothetical protein